MMIKLTSHWKIAATGAWNPLQKKEKKEVEMMHSSSGNQLLSRRRRFSSVSPKTPQDFLCVPQVPGWAIWKIFQIFAKHPRLGRGSPSTFRTQWVNNPTIPIVFISSLITPFCIFPCFFYYWYMFRAIFFSVKNYVFNQSLIFLLLNWR